MLYDYEDTAKETLKLCKGAVIKVIHQLQSGWWIGNIDDKVGFFPSNYCEVIVPENPPTDDDHLSDNDISQPENASHHDLDNGENENDVSYSFLITFKLLLINITERLRHGE